MKKVLPIIFVLALLGGAGYFLMGKKTAPANQAESTPLPQEKTGGVINSIKDAMMGMQPIECAYTDEQGNKVNAMIKGENVKVAGMDFGQNGMMGHALIKGSQMYIWEEGSQSGMMVTFNREADKSGTDTNKKDEAIQDLEKYKDSCKSGNFPDSVFEIPAEVKFSELPQNMMDLNQSQPNNGGTYQTPDKADLEKMMEQYKR